MNPIEKYFYAEKYESVLFVSIGIVAITMAIYFFVKVKQPFYVGIAYPWITVALIQIIVGSTVYVRSPKDITRVTEMVRSNKMKIQTEEIPRMKVVMKNFKVYRWVEIILILLGIIMLFYFQTLSFWKGVGLGLFIQASFMLLLDFFAENRGEAYLSYLQTLN